MDLGETLTGSYSIMLVDVMRLRAWFERLDVEATIASIDLTWEDEFRVFRVSCEPAVTNRILQRRSDLCELFWPRKVTVYAVVDVADADVHIRITEE